MQLQRLVKKVGWMGEEVSRFMSLLDLYNVSIDKLKIQWPPPPEESQAAPAFASVRSAYAFRGGLHPAAQARATGVKRRRHVRGSTKNRARSRSKSKKPADAPQ